MKLTCLRTAALLLAAVMLCCALAACGGKKKGGSPETKGLAVIHEPEFGGVYLQMTIDDFNALGFVYGDSVRVSFSNGYTLDDLPYYNGYYTLTGSPLLIAYPGYDYIKAAVNNGDDLWVIAGLTESDTADVTLVQSGKYASIQNARNISYKDDRELFSSDEVFANFRNITAGSIQPGVLYRSASPCDNQHNRAPYVDALIKDAGVRCIVDLADNEEKILKYISTADFACPYFLTVYHGGGVLTLALNMNYSSREFKAKIVSGLTAMTEQQGPYLIHCTEGKDRTGFVCMLIEALAGATYQEIVDDYMVTYDNYFGITPEKDKDRYDVIVDSVLDPMIRSMVNDDTVDVHTADLSGYAGAFLQGAGMTQDEIAALKTVLCGEE